MASQSSFDSNSPRATANRLYKPSNRQAQTSSKATSGVQLEQQFPIFCSDLLPFESQEVDHGEDPSLDSPYFASTRRIQCSPAQGRDDIPQDRSFVIEASRCELLDAELQDDDDDFFLLLPSPQEAAAPQVGDERPAEQGHSSVMLRPRFTNHHDIFRSCE